MEKGVTELIRIERLIDSPWQGRQLSINSTDKAVVELVEDLVKSIELNGLLQPVIVRVKGDRYELIDGHRRALAAKILGMESIPALIIEADDRKAQIASVVSNLERKNLHPIEKAIAYRKILDDGIFASISSLAESIGKTSAYVGEILNSLQLDSRIIDDLIRNRTITDNRMLRALRKFHPVGSEGRSDSQWELYNRMIKEKLTRNEVLKLVNTKKAIKAGNKLSIKETEKSIRFVVDKNSMTKDAIRQLTVIIEQLVASFEAGHDQPTLGE